MFRNNGKNGGVRKTLAFALAAIIAVTITTDTVPFAYAKEVSIAGDTAQAAQGTVPKGAASNMYAGAGAAFEPEVGSGARPRIEPKTEGDIEPDSETGGKSETELEIESGDEPGTEPGAGANEEDSSGRKEPAADRDSSAAGSSLDQEHAGEAPGSVKEEAGKEPEDAGSMVRGAGESSDAADRNDAKGTSSYYGCIKLTIKTQGGLYGGTSDDIILYNTIGTDTYGSTPVSCELPAQNELTRDGYFLAGYSTSSSSSATPAFGRTYDTTISCKYRTESAAQNSPTSKTLYAVWLSNTKTSGIYRNVDWSIDSDGVLTLGKEGQAQTYSSKGSESQSSWPWNKCRTMITEVVFAGPVNGTGSMAYMFSNFSYPDSLDLSDFGTAGVTDMAGMFFGCRSLTGLDVSGLDTGNVTSMSQMFESCRSLTGLDVSGFDTRNVTNMNEMFCNCGSLTALDISGLNTSKVTIMAGMFNGCSNLAEIDVSDLDTSKVRTMDHMFDGCTGLTGLDLSTFDGTSLEQTAYMFRDCRNLASIDFTGFNTASVTRFDSMFENCYSLTDFDISHWNTSSAENMQGLFMNCSSITDLVLTTFDTSNVTDMRSMFYGCDKMTALDISGFDTSNVTEMGGMFAGDPKLNTVVLGETFRFLQTSLPSGTWLKYGSEEKFSESRLASVYDGATMADTYYKVKTITITKHWEDRLAGSEAEGRTKPVIELQAAGATVSIPYRASSSRKESAWTMADDTTWTYAFDILDDGTVPTAVETSVPEDYETDSPQLVQNDEATITNTAEQEEILPSPTDYKDPPWTLPIAFANLAGAVAILYCRRRGSMIPPRDGF